MRMEIAFSICCDLRHIINLTTNKLSESAIG